uniref:Uncharacterized protein n=1 Tax=viral metagenome TaxID=1070528 RepID=A0A6C0K0T9_9ZZZZ
MQDTNLYLVLNNCDYFAIAEEYVQTKNSFRSESWFETIQLWMDLIGDIVLLFFLDMSSTGIAVSMYKTAYKWRSYIRFLEIEHKVHEWKMIIHSMGGPTITTNDEHYQAYVYADGMQRLHNTLFGLTKKSTKRLQ